MFTIGDFARHGRVSVRMLRHYDEIGLLRPARTDPSSGYRYYDAVQLADLNRVVALKELGFTLEQVGRLAREHVGTDELRGMLALRRAQLEEAIAADRSRLVQVEARLRSLESEHEMSQPEVIVKTVPAVRVAELSAVASGGTPDEIGPVVRPLCEELGRLFEKSGLTPVGPLVCYYDRQDDYSVVVHAALPITAGGTEPAGLTITELPAATVAATVHRGSMDAVLPSYQAIARWLDVNGRASTGSPREVYHETSDDEDAWVTELQEPFVN